MNENNKIEYNEIISVFDENPHAIELIKDSLDTDWEALVLDITNYGIKNTTLIASVSC